MANLLWLVFVVAATNHVHVEPQILCQHALLQPIRPAIPSSCEKDNPLQQRNG